ncbi:MAG: NAD-dependent epimerase [Desulfobacteraceae bacterium]|nr:NAD-dependent epimerase [Desulfobacteraceae bacterium]
MQKVLVTGAAGFIGFHSCRRLLDEGREVVGLDNLNGYYDVALKKARLALLTGYDRFRFVKASLEDRGELSSIMESGRFHCAVNLAAQAGVRYSLVNPHAYADSNLSGFLNILEGCRNTGVRHLVFASSSSVYGLNAQTPFSTHDNVDHPVSLYAATKKANELMAHSYSHLYGISVTGLRFFTVYGPWGRPDMALFKFTKAILDDEPIEIYNHGKMQRDFTYIDDITEGILRVVDRPPVADPDWSGNASDPSSSSAPYRIYNIGNNRPVGLMEFIEILENALGKKAKKKFLPMQPGDVTTTYADITALEEAVGFRPGTPLENGIRAFVAWYKQYYRSFVPIVPRNGTPASHRAGLGA